MNATITIRYAQHVRVVRIFSNSERTRAFTAVVSPPVSSRKTSSSVARSTVSSWRTIPFAAASSPTRAGARSTAERLLVHRRDRRSLRGQELAQPRGSGLCTRVAPCAPASTSAIVACWIELAAVDDHDAVDGLRDLGEHVARDENRATLGRERAQEVA